MLPRVLPQIAESGVASSGHDDGWEAREIFLPVEAPYVVRTLCVVRSQRLELRLTDQERSIDQAAAAAVGESLSDFFRRAAANRAADVLVDQGRITLTEQEAVRFLDALETVDEDTVARLADLRSRA